MHETEVSLCLVQHLTHHRRPQSFPLCYDDPRFREMVEAVKTQEDENGRYTAISMYRAWKGWSFADNKRPPPWLTFLVRRMQPAVADESECV